MKIIRLIPFLLLFLFFPVIAGAEEITIQQALKYVQKQYDHTENLSASFTQETYSNSDSQPIMAKGKVFFKRPGLMRWEYELPEPQLIVTYKDDVYIYEKNADQVMVMPRKRFLSSEISRAFFFGRGSLEKFFKVTNDNECRLDKQRWCLRLKPIKTDSNLVEMRIIIDPVSHMIQEMWITDALSNRTHIRFRDLQTNKKLPDDLFTFKIPEGVEVYRAD